MNRIVIKIIREYQKLHAGRSSHCRFHPTCSEYGIESFRKHGFFRALFLIAYRILRCNPLSKGGYDPVPPNTVEKLFRNDYHH